MKRYVKHFLWLFILLGILLIAMIGVRLTHAPKEQVTYTRTNTECLTEERVFDEADRLTDAEEMSLREMIARKEQQIGCDIIFMTCNGHEGYIRDFADDFYDNNKFGYDAPWGDGALFVADFETGDAWFCTTGRVETRYSTSMIDSMVELVCDDLRGDTCRAAMNYVDRLVRDMEHKSGDGILEILKPLHVVIFSLIVTVLFLLIQLAVNIGKKTTTANTYVVGGHPNLRHKADTFLSKHTTSRKIESSSSGGGGHHISGGGHSHGGGGGHF
ncbi:MAG: TPM domain-containing protein [Lachnospiraceae bacterium]|jgi:uncharacterized membrane protein YgcG|nr:TPM domain-containing protein [Lachnospiraceae bacterium]